MLYFPRSDLAEHFFRTIEVGLSNRFTIFAPRRKGKGLFLLNDIAASANQYKLHPVYIGLWDSPDKPQAAIVDKLEQALESLSSKNAVSRMLNANIILKWTFKTIKIRTC